MVSGPLLYILLIGELIFIVSVCLYLFSLIQSALYGAPYVPTKRREIGKILSGANLKKGQTFLELGCGDGRVVRQAAKDYQIKGTGIDINYFVIIKARIKATLEHLSVSFQIKNVLNFPLQGYQVIYLFMMPELLTKLAPKMAKEAKKGVLIISHGFKIDTFKPYLIKTLKDKSFATYYYKIR